jgi:alpha-tubulin suppressor-like RCC1 family protein
MHARKTPVDVVGLAGAAIGVAAGSEHTCAILTTGALACWGDNHDGELGDGTLTSSSAPVTLTGIGGVKALSAGLYETCAIDGGGRVRCWGSNAGGQIGDGTTTTRRMPTEARGL